LRVKLTGNQEKGSAHLITRLCGASYPRPAQTDPRTNAAKQHGKFAECFEYSSAYRTRENF
jgi:hypothetical protein